MHADPVVAARDRVDAAIAALPPAAVLGSTDAVGPALTVISATAALRAMLRSRELDVAARTMRARGDGYYTIASAGHEANALLGVLLRPTDPCLLHYRSGALVCARIAAHGRDPVDPTLRSFAAAASDPVAQGRHKVWGDPATWVLPQTSTIASHVPKAAGLAFALARARRVGSVDLPSDAIVCCSLGDASINHASAQAGITSARYAHRLGRPCPLLLVVEDNGIGISTGTPPGWVEASLGNLPGLRFVDADGPLDVQAERVAEAIDACRRSRGPVVLRLVTVRLWGHAGSDVEAAYRMRAAITADEARDPLPAAIGRLGELGALGRADARRLAEEVRAEVAGGLDRLRDLDALSDAEAVMAPLRPTRPADAVRSRARAAVSERSEEVAAWAGRAERGTLAAHLNAALHETLAARPGVLVLGEDVARKGGVYGVTAGLLDAFGSERVLDTLLDETTVLGVAQGAALAGILPLPEIQYLAYVHNALDQLRGEACSTGFFSGGSIRTPMVVRIASFAYQRGFGGHFHNDDAIGALRDIPGLVLVAPSSPADGARVLRGAVALAAEAGLVVAVLEPIALYHERDLLDPGDGGWLEAPTEAHDLVLPGQVTLHEPPGGGSNADVLVVTYANGVRMARRVAARLAERGVAVRVLDLRWLSPLPTEAVRTAASAVGRVLVADECRATGGGIADAVIADLVEAEVACRIRSVRSADSYVPLGPAAEHVLLGEGQIEAGISALLRQPAAV